MQDDYWTHDIPLFEGKFRYYHHTPRPVRGHIHLADERYFDATHDLIPPSTPKGTRTYVLLQPYVFEPEIILTIGLYKAPKAYADQDSAIGEVVRGKQEGVREVRIGNSQAWYYPEDKLLVLWECFLESFVRDKPLLKDDNMRELWQQTEKWLLTQFPKARKIATPFSDPIFPTADYQKFLAELGYQPSDKGVFSKIVG